MELTSHAGGACSFDLLNKHVCWIRNIYRDHANWGQTSVCYFILVLNL